MIDIDTSDVTRLSAKISANIPRVNKTIELMLLKSLNDIEGEVIDRTPVNTGKLKQSITSGIIGRRPDRLVGEVTHKVLPYALAMEKGLPPGTWPNLGALELWVIRKNIAKPPASKGMAFIIGRAIAEGRSKGIANTGAHMFENGLKAAAPKIHRDWALASKRLADETLK